MIRIMMKDKMIVKSNDRAKHQVQGVSGCPCRAATTDNWLEEYTYMHVITKETMLVMLYQSQGHCQSGHR